MGLDSESASLGSLLSILRDKKPRHLIMSAVNAETVELTRKLLFMRDFVNLSSYLSDTSDIKNLIDFLLYLLRNGYLSNSDAKFNAPRRARRLMYRIMTKTPVMPKSVFVVGVNMKVHREYIDGGGFGLVFKGKLKGSPVALKVLYKTHNNINFCREALMWRSLNHPFVLPFFGIYENEATSQFFVVSPYMTNGTLSQWRKKAGRSVAAIEERILEVAQGMEYIHLEGVVHGDLRGENILLDDNFHVQISDFGLTRHSESSVTQSGAAQHYNFAAPELFDEYSPNDADDAESLSRAQRADIYAFGCLYYEIHFDTIPFSGIKDIQIMRRVARGERPPRLNEPPLRDEVWRLIHRCWATEVSKRPAMRDIAKKMKAWRLATPDTDNPKSEALQDPFGSRWPRFSQFGSISKHPINEISFNGASSLDGSGALLTTKLLVGFNSRSVSTPPPPLPIRARSPPPLQITSSTQNKSKITIAIDFGTTFSGFMYAFRHFPEDKIQQEASVKIPTCLLYDRKGRVLAWGLEAKSAGPIHGSLRCEWFKCLLEPRNLHDNTSIDPRLPILPPKKQAIDLIVDYLDRLWEYVKYQIVRQQGTVADLNSAEIWLTVPATWDQEGRNIMREAAIAAELVRKERGSDHRWRDRLHIVTEHEAAAVHCVRHADVYHLRSPQNFMVVDAGGGSCTLAVYKVIGEAESLEIAEMSRRSGPDCGSIFIDMRFRELVKMLLKDHPVHLDSASLAYFVHSFTETNKLTYRGRKDDTTIFHFTCFNREDPHDPSVGLMNGQLCIQGKLLRDIVFDPVINQILALIDEQIQGMNQLINVLFLVGSAGSDYLKQRIEVELGSKIAIIARPPDAGTAMLRGAIQLGLSERQLVSSVLVPRSYIMNVKLLAEREDMLNKPEYVTNRYGDITICENRLQYLLGKGAIIRKGERSTTKLYKFSKNALDSTFVATVYASDEDMLMRYADEGKLTELCKWTIDLSSLPAFKANASVHQSGGFCTEFEVGIEIDNTEVRGVLLHDGQEWGWQWITIDELK